VLTMGPSSTVSSLRMVLSLCVGPILVEQEYRMMMKAEKKFGGFREVKMLG
jgi:hypothetical protein